MPRYAVIVRQFVEEVASIVVEAPGPSDAMAKVRMILIVGDYDPDWQEGTGTDGNPAEVVDCHQTKDTEELTDV